MKTKILRGVFALAVTVATGYGVNQSMQKDTDLSEMALSNVEALGQYLEDGCDGCHIPNYGRVPRTESCKLELGGGYFTASVRRVCDITPNSASTCTPVECGGYF